MINNETLSPAVSVCISVHNTEAYLPRCLDSLVSQTFRDFEIVLVNNGSTDRSAEIMKRYQREHPDLSITVVEQNDRGLAQGRQTGVDHAKGEYITFLDADDYVTPNAYDRLYDTARQGDYDIVECLTERNGQLIGSPFEGECPPRKIVCRYFKDGDVPSMLWMRLYRRSLFNAETFPKTYVNNEDNYVFPCVVFKAASYFCLKERLHFYSTDNEAAVMSLLMVRKRDENRMYENRKRFLESLPFVESNIDVPHQDAECRRCFNIYVNRACLSYCVTNSKLATYRARFDYIYEVLKTNKRDFNRFFQQSNEAKIAAEKIIALLGFETGLRVFIPLYKIQKEIGGTT